MTIVRRITHSLVKRNSQGDYLIHSCMSACGTKDLFQQDSFNLFGLVFLYFFNWNKPGNITFKLLFKYKVLK